MRSTDELDPKLLAVFEAMGGDDDATSLKSFHDPFFSLDPSTATLVSREQLAMALPMRRQMFGAAGARGTTLRDIEVQRLDAEHAVVRTRWHLEFADKAAEPLILESSYLMRLVDGEWQVIAYINHHDIAQLLAQREPTSPGRA